MSAPRSMRTVTLWGAAHQLIAEGKDGFAGGAGVAVFLADGVVGDEVDVAMQAIEQGDQLLRMLRSVVDAGQQNIFNGDPAAGLIDIPAQGGEQDLQRVFFVDGHKL